MGLLDFLGGGPPDGTASQMTPQQMGLLGMAAQMGQAFVPQAASRLPLAKPNMAYMLAQGAGGYGQGYGQGLQQQQVRAQTMQTNLGTADALSKYNIVAPYLGAKPLSAQDLQSGNFDPKTMQIAQSLPNSSQPQAGGQQAQSAPPQASAMPQPGPSPTGAPAPMGAPPGMAPQAPPAGAQPQVGGNGLPQAPGNPFAQSLVYSALGVNMSPAQKVAQSYGFNPYDPESWSGAPPLVQAEIAKASGVNQIIGGDRAGVPLQSYNSTSGTYSPMPGTFDTMRQGALANSAGAAAGKLPYTEAQSAFEQGLKNQNTIISVPLPNGQTRMMSQADALGVTQGRPLVKPPDPMTVKGDETVSPAGSVIPAPPPPQGNTMPGFTAGVPANAADVTKGWTESLQPGTAAESQLTQIAEALKQTQSGGLSEIKAEVANTLTGAGLPSLASAVMASKDVSNVQTILHDNIFSTLSTLKSATAGSASRFTQAEFKKIGEEAMSNPDISPQANFNIVTQLLGAIRANRTMVGDWSQASSAPMPSGRQWTDPSKFESAWIDRNPLQGFQDQAGAQLGSFQGMVTAPTSAVKALQMNPGLAPQFDAKYGPRASTQYLSK
jgi:hypothetical protein